MRWLAVWLGFHGALMAQTFAVKGKVTDDTGKPVPFAVVAEFGTTTGAQADENGELVLNLPAGTYTLFATAAGRKKSTVKITVPAKRYVSFQLPLLVPELDEVVVTGTFREVGKDDSPVNVDIITPALFRKASAPNLFEATSLVNGVKPQINCNVCNTGDIHINGLEGPYTLILIDGMPIVSGLSSVYGLMGIPTSMIERLEIAKGPAAALYGSESMGGTINLITKKASHAPKFFMDYFGTSYLENNLDLSARLKLGQKTNWLIGANGYYLDKLHDINKDGFTDVTLQERVSVFNKIDFDRPENRQASIASRYVYEDRWGGQMQYTPRFRGGDSVYGESIYTTRAELISKYQWPVKERVFSQLSYNFHDQNSFYGVTPFNAKQSTAFAQTYWSRTIGWRHELLAGVNYRHLWLDDNTAVTTNADGTNRPDENHTAGVFVQNETAIDSLARHKLLLGMRLDYNNVYRFVPSPRIAYKYAPRHNLVMRVNLATGFRIVNVFTEDHAALTGARDVVFLEKIKPETSYNGSFNTVFKQRVTSGSMLIWDATAFYYHFTNKIFANYDVDPEKVIYQNLDGYAFSRGLSLNLSLATPGPFKFTLGGTYADVQNVTRDSSGALASSRQLQAPLWSGVIIAGYELPKIGWRADITGNVYGPQRLPVFPNDFRPEYSPWFCLLNAQLTKKLGNWEIYGGVKNLLNFIPDNPIMRPNDPFDKRVADAADNPHGFTFDPSYNYAPIQGIRGYLGVRFSVF